MDYERIEELAALARFYHRNQVDLGGEPYFGHLSRVAKRLEEFGLEKLVIAGYFHDFVEDVLNGSEILAGINFTHGERVLIDGMNVGEKPKDMSYDKYYLLVYIRGIAKDPELVLVKIADALDNSDPSRIVDNTEKSIRRTYKYKITIEYLLKSLRGTQYSFDKIAKIAPKFASEITERLKFFNKFYEENKAVLDKSGYAKVKNEFGM